MDTGTGTGTDTDTDMDIIRATLKSTTNSDTRSPISMFWRFLTLPLLFTNYIKNVQSTPLKVDLYLATDDLGNAWINGQSFATQTNFQNPFQYTAMIDNSSDILIAIKVQDLGGKADMMASVFVNSTVVAVSGDNSGWKAYYSTSPPSDWRTNVTFDDSQWFNVTRDNVCPYDIYWPSAGFANTAGANALAIWGPNCTTNMNAAYYRLHISRTDIQRHLQDKSIDVEVRHTCDDMSNVYIDGKYFSISSSYYTAQTATYYTSPGPLLIAFVTTDVGGTAGFLASVQVNGLPYTWTGDLSQKWMVTYDYDTTNIPDAGWSSNYTFDDSAWVPIDATNTETAYDYLKGIPYVMALGAPAQFIWGGLDGVTSKFNTIYWRLKLNLNKTITSNLIEAPATGQYMLTAQSFVGYIGAVYINGTIYAPTDFSGIQTSQQYVNDGKLLIAFQVENFDNNIYGLLASVFLNGVSIASSGDSSNWKVSYEFTGTALPSDWNTDVNFDASSWQSYTGSCPGQNSGVIQAASTMSTNGSQPQVLWGPECSNSQISLVLYRLLIDVSPILLLPAPPPYIGPQKVEVRFAAADYVTATIGGQLYTGYDIPSQTSQSIVQYVDAGFMLITFAVQQYTSSSGGLIAVVLVNDRPVTVSGDLYASAKINYNFNPVNETSAGWSTDLNFDDSTWLPWSANLCLNNGWQASLTNVTAGLTNVSPKLIWGPSCASSGNQFFVRIKVNVQFLRAAVTTYSKTKTTSDLAISAAKASRSSKPQAKPTQTIDNTVTPDTNASTILGLEPVVLFSIIGMVAFTILIFSVTSCWWMSRKSKSFKPVKSHTLDLDDSYSHDLTANLSTMSSKDLEMIEVAWSMAQESRGNLVDSNPMLTISDYPTAYQTAAIVQHTNAPVSSPPQLYFTEELQEQEYQ